MIRKVLFAILLAHASLIAQGKPSRIILQAPPPDPNAIPQPQVPAQLPPANIPPVELPQITPQVPGNPNPGQIPPPQFPVIQPPQTIPGTATNPPVTTSGSAQTTAAQAATSSAPATTVANAPATTSGSNTVTASAQTTTIAPGTGTPAIVTQIPVPITPAPVTPAPVTPAPVTARPTPFPTPFPTTANPTTSAPTTASPTLAPLPAGYEYGTWGQVCPIPANEQKCVIPGQVIQSEAQNNRGIITCDRTADCCKCQAIQCGVPPGTGNPIEPHGCIYFGAGDYGAYGVKQVIIIGNPDISRGPGGAQINCGGRSACQDMNLFGDSVTHLMCNVDHSCAGAMMQIDNPADGFFIDCNGPESCKNAKITVNIGTPIPEGSMCNPQFLNERRFGGIKCNAANSCDGLELTINNRGCDNIIFETFELDQVTGSIFNFNGKMDIGNCVCGPSCNFAHGLGKCFQNLERLICPDIRSCMNMVKTIINPMDMFYLECSNELSCAMAQLTIDLEQDPLSANFAYQEPVRFIQSLKFGGPNSGRGATIYIHNHQLMDPQIPGMPVIVTIGVLECSADNSCQGLTIYTGDNVNIVHRICGSFGACAGCMIKRDEFDVGYPCNPDPIPQLQWTQPQQPQFIPQNPPQFIPVTPQQQQPQFIPQI